MTDSFTGRAARGAREAQNLCVIISNPLESVTETAHPDEKVQAEHVDFLQDLFDRRILFGSGPQVDETGRRHGGVVYILQGVSLAEAKEIAAIDPHVRRGLRDVAVYPWRRVWFGG
jgi:uncharacterized protein YciI